MGLRTKDKVVDLPPLLPTLKSVPFLRDAPPRALKAAGAIVDVKTSPMDGPLVFVASGCGSLPHAESVRATEAAPAARTRAEDTRERFTVSHATGTAQAGYRRRRVRPVSGGNGGSWSSSMVSLYQRTQLRPARLAS